MCCAKRRKWDSPGQHEKHGLLGLGYGASFVGLLSLLFFNPIDVCLLGLTRARAFSLAVFQLFYPANSITANNHQNELSDLLC